MRVVVVGASVAGVTVAEALRAAGHDGELVLVGDEVHAPYGRPPLSKQVLDGSWTPDRAALRTTRELAALDVRMLTGRPATGLDTGRHEVSVGRERIRYDALVVATGVAAARPDVPGIDRAHVLRTRDDAEAVRAALLTARRVVVLGTGVLASELASAARHVDGTVAAADRAVTVVGRSGTMSFGAVGPLLSDRLVALHRGNDVDLRPGAGVAALLPTDGTGDRTSGSDVTVGGGTSVVLADGSGALPADLVLAATGSRPRTDWLAGSDLVVDDGVVCDAHGRAAPDVWAVGDVARWHDPLTGRHARVEHQTNAIEQAHVVARTIVHGHLGTPAPSLFWSEVHGVRIQAVGRFDPGRPLVTREEHEGRAVLVAETADGRTTGVVGWRAAKAFRIARAAMDVPLAPPGPLQAPRPPHPLDHDLHEERIA